MGDHCDTCDKKYTSPNEEINVNTKKGLMSLVIMWCPYCEQYTVLENWMT